MVINKEKNRQFSHLNLAVCDSPPNLLGQSNNIFGTRAPYRFHLLQLNYLFIVAFAEEIVYYIVIKKRKECAMLISRQENEELYRLIFRDEDLDDLIFKDAEFSVSEK